MQLNTKQNYAFNQVMTGGNVFISGPGGVGKSVLVNKIRDLCQDDTVFLAPTGIAAQNIKGSTIHRTFRFRLGYLDPAQRAHVNDKVRELFSDDSIKRIVIDEISMVRADIFTAVDIALRKSKRRNKPFGGLQVIVVGDFFQLSPVLNTNSTEGEHFLKEFSSPFCFDTDSWREAGFQTIELDEIMRQSDAEFINALNSIRTRDMYFEDSLEFLNQKGMEKEDLAEDMLFLCSTNKEADTVNKHNYDDLLGEERVYFGKKKGPFKDMPVPECLSLKEGCKVLVCANAQDESYFNGMTGIVQKMFNDSISVKLETGDTVLIREFKWTEFEYFNGPDGMGIKPVAEYQQFPLKLGYACTVHKSQGLSLSQAAIYTGNGFFAHGQAYVGFSRLRTLAGLYVLKEIARKDIIVDRRVTDFYENNKFANLMNM